MYEGGHTNRALSIGTSPRLTTRYGYLTTKTTTLHYRTTVNHSLECLIDHVIATRRGVRHHPVGGAVVAFVTRVTEERHPTAEPRHEDYYNEQCEQQMSSSSVNSVRPSVSVGKSCTCISLLLVSHTQLPLEEERRGDLGARKSQTS